jgi:hypothetical protein
MGYDLSIQGTVTFNKKYNELAAPRGMNFPDFLVKEIKERYNEDISYTEGSDAEGDTHITIYISADSYRWYDYEENLVDFTSIFTDCCFDLSIDGEESDDFREAVIKDGKAKSCYGEIVYWSKEGEEEAKKLILASNEPVSAKGFLI